MELFRQQPHIRHAHYIYPNDVMNLVYRHRCSKREAFDRVFARVPPNTVSLYVTGIGLESLPSMKHLTQLKNLDISVNGLQELPELPEGLIMLDCSSNHLTSLKNTPSTVRFLVGSRNEISTLSWLPQGLTSLAVPYNKLEDIDGFPPSLTLCNMSYNQLTFLPPLPATIQQLDCMHNNLVELPASLPTSLQRLLCSGNPRLLHLPPLPHNLKWLIVKGCGIVRLPTFPEGLSIFDASNSSVSQMVNIPPSLVQNGGLLDRTPIGNIIDFPEAALFSERLIRVRLNLEKLNRFRELYYTLKYKRQFRQWLWIKVRLPRIERENHPDRLQERLEAMEREGTEVDMEAVLQSFGNS
jgi:Leucine-rich repeat (LRR) protein